jgi:hypothetical protein
MKSDPCSLQQTARDDEKTSNYILWLPNYKRKQCESSAYSQCDATSRFGPQKVAQESFLQGRGQVTGPRGCFASGLRFLPKDVFPTDAGEPQCHDMSLYPRQTASKKSCGSVSEVDMTARLRPLPGEYAGAFVPKILDRRSLVPNVLDRRVVLTKGITLGNKGYPSWTDIQKKRAPYSS